MEDIPFDLDTLRREIEKNISILCLNETEDNISCQFDFNDEIFQRTGQGYWAFVLDFLYTYFNPVIMFVGIFGNSMTICVFMLTHLKRLSSSIYLSTLAAADLIFLSALFVTWLEYINIHALNTNGLCETTIFLRWLSEFLSIWMVLMFTIERYMVVYYPMKKKQFCKRSKAIAISLTLVALAMVFYGHTFWRYGVVRLSEDMVICAPIGPHDRFRTVFESSNALIGYVVPSLLTVLLNIRLIKKIHHYQSQLNRDMEHKRKYKIRFIHKFAPNGSMIQTSYSSSGKMKFKFIPTTGDNNKADPPHYELHNNVGPTATGNGVAFGSFCHVSEAGAAQVATSANATKFGHGGASPGDDSSSPHGSDQFAGGGGGTGTMPADEILLGTSIPLHQHVVRGRSQYRTARMLLILSSVSVLLGLPYHILRLQFFVRSTINHHKADSALFNLLQFCEIVYFSKFCVNIFIYALCGRQFRSAGKRLILKIARIDSH